MTGISVAEDGRRAGGHGGLFDVEAGRLARLEVRTPDVRQVEEHVLVRAIDRVETVIDV